jgi:hypothetical protein
MPLASCGVPYACNNCLAKIEQEQREKFVKEMRDKAGNIISLIAVGVLFLIFGAIVVVVAIRMDGPVEDALWGVGLTFTAFPFIFIQTRMQRTLRNKAMNMLNITNEMLRDRELHEFNYTVPKTVQGTGHGVDQISIAMLEHLDGLANDPVNLDKTMNEITNLESCRDVLGIRFDSLKYGAIRVTLPPDNRLLIWGDIKMMLFKEFKKLRAVGEVSVHVYADRPVR